MAFENARAVMLKDGYRTPMFIPLKENRPADLIVAPPQNRIDKYLIMRDIAYLVRRIGADGLIHISEAWRAAPKDIPKGKFAVDATKRGEEFVLAAVNSAGEQINLSATVIRKKLKKHKVKQLLPTEVETGGRMVSMAPVLEVWGKLDVLRLEEEDESMLWIEKHFKPETSDT
jgi:hypothetical protein